MHDDIVLSINMHRPKNMKRLLSRRADASKQNEKPTFFSLGH